uniref:Uncharacterized protein n=1 Tax=Plectus sambesii TaxID=2011161 RepID=A0A914V2Y5_9BILA
MSVAAYFLPRERLDLCLKFAFPSVPPPLSSFSVLLAAPSFGAPGRTGVGVRPRELLTSDSSPSFPDKD